MNPPKIITYILPRVKDILWVGVFMSVLGMGPRMMNMDGDLGRHLTVGSTILQTGLVPTIDLFSHTMYGMSLTPHEWLSQVLFALANRLMGLDGVVLLCGVVIATAFGLVYQQALKNSQRVLVAVVVVVLAIAASSLHWLTRPHIFTFLMMGLWMMSLERMRSGHLKEWWRLPVLMLFWANLHGAFIAGFATWAIFGFGLAWDCFWDRSMKDLPKHFFPYFLLAGGVSFLATLCNPSGLGLWGTSLGYVGNSYLVNHTMEYLSPDFHEPSTWAFLLLAGLCMVSFGLQSEKKSAARIFLVTAWIVMALYSARNIPLFAIVAAPFLAEMWGDWLKRYNNRIGLITRLQALEGRLFQMEQSLKGWFLPGLVLVLSGILLLNGAVLSFSGTANAFDPIKFPVGAVNWMSDHQMEGNGFNYFTWGGYLLYRLYPEQRVFIDGQTDFYGEALTRQYDQFFSLGVGWEKVLEQYSIQWVLIPVDTPFSSVMKNRPGWTVLYEDQTAVLIAVDNPTK